MAYKLKAKQFNAKGEEFATFEQIFKTIKELDKKLNEIQVNGFVNYEIYQDGKLWQSNYIDGSTSIW